MTDLTRYERQGRLQGRCLCGAVTIDVDGGHVAAVGACHCYICQQWSGALYATFDAKADAVTVTGEVGRYRSSEHAERTFCPTCGAHLWYRNVTREAADYELMAGLFREAAGFPLVSEIYVDQAPDYVSLAGDHSRKTAADYESRTTFVEGDDP